MRITPSTLSILADRARAGRVVVFDTETTGGSSWDEICQIAAAEYVGGNLTRTLALYVCPTCPMNPWAEAVHGLSMEFLHEHGIAPVLWSHTIRSSNPAVHGNHLGSSNSHFEGEGCAEFSLSDETPMVRPPPRGGMPRRGRGEYSARS